MISFSLLTAVINLYIFSPLLESCGTQSQIFYFDIGANGNTESLQNPPEAFKIVKIECNTCPQKVFHLGRMHILIVMLKKCPTMQGMRKG